MNLVTQVRHVILHARGRGEVPGLRGSLLSPVIVICSSYKSLIIWLVPAGTSWIQKRPAGSQLVHRRICSLNSSFLKIKFCFPFCKSPSPPSR